MTPTKRALLSLLLVGACISGPGAIAYALWSAPATATIAVTVESPAPTASAPTAPPSFECSTRTNSHWTVSWGTSASATSYVLDVITADSTVRPSATPTPYATISPAPVAPSASVEISNNRYSWYSVRAVNAAGSSDRSTTELRLFRSGNSRHECTPVTAP